MITEEEVGLTLKLYVYTKTIIRIRIIDSRGSFELPSIHNIRIVDDNTITVNCTRQDVVVIASFLADRKSITLSHRT